MSADALGVVASIPEWITDSGAIAAAFTAMVLFPIALVQLHRRVLRPFVAAIYQIRDAVQVAPVVVTNREDIDALKAGQFELIGKVDQLGRDLRQHMVDEDQIRARTEQMRLRHEDQMQALVASVHGQVAKMMEQGDPR